MSPSDAFDTALRKSVLFLHGWSSGGGTSRKESFLRSWGYDVMAPALSDFSFWRAVCQAQTAYDDFQPHVIVGSSRGAAAAMNLKNDDTPMVLIAPPWKRFGTATSISKGPACIIIHSPKDDLVPFSDTVELCLNSPGVAVMPAGTDHRMNCVSSQNAMKRALRLLLEGR